MLFYAIYIYPGQCERFLFVGIVLNFQSSGWLSCGSSLLNLIGVTLPFQYIAHRPLKKDAFWVHGMSFFMEGLTFWIECSKLTFKILHTCTLVIAEFFYILADLAIGLTANDAVKLRRSLLLVGIYFGTERTRQSKITTNDALIIPERIIAACVNAKAFLLW